MYTLAGVQGPSLGEDFSEESLLTEIGVWPRLHKCWWKRCQKRSLLIVAQVLASLSVQGERSAWGTWPNLQGVTPKITPDTCTEVIALYMSKHVIIHVKEMMTMKWWLKNTLENINCKHLTSVSNPYTQNVNQSWIVSVSQWKYTSKSAARQRMKRFSD